MGALSADERIDLALDVAKEFGQVDGAHHKAWVIDQVARALLQDDYEAWVIDICYNQGEITSYDEGIAP